MFKLIIYLSWLLSFEQVYSFLSTFQPQFEFQLNLNSNFV